MVMASSGKKRQVCPGGDARPWVIWRIWSAKPEQGHVMMYLDGSDTPAVDLPFAGYFDRRNEPFTYPLLVHDASSGKNNYIPIGYQKSCKIVVEKGWGQYYHFVYTTYPKDTVLPTFTRTFPRRKKPLSTRPTPFWPTAVLILPVLVPVRPPSMPLAPSSLARRRPS